ncbi:hypothetical protein V4890_20355 [Ralstonia solanacearum species complex bacterium KE056]|uniref:hypothetical protein n=1 Tax=Ralstonia solanacearum species complex bacterium KE056 TaxID=3119585 RepID=UPI002FC2D572
MIAQDIEPAVGKRRRICHLKPPGCPLLHLFAPLRRIVSGTTGELDPRVDEHVRNVRDMRRSIGKIIAIGEASMLRRRGRDRRLQALAARSNAHAMLILKIKINNTQIDKL